jgi:hypothetical protein
VVQRKNNWAETPDYDITPQPRPFIDRQRPGAGYRHLLLKRDIDRFVELLADWEELSQGLNAIVLAPGDPGTLGWHRRGIVAVCAWDRELVKAWHPAIAAENAFFLERLGVPEERTEEGHSLCHFTEGTARAFQLLAVLLHELGHHHDRMTTRGKRRPCRGEPFADRYAERRAAAIWDRFIRVFEG